MSSSLSSSNYLIICICICTTDDLELSHRHTVCVIHRCPLTVFVASSKHFCFIIRPCVLSAFEIFLLMHYINLRFTYLLTAPVADFIVIRALSVLICICISINRSQRGRFTKRKQQPIGCSVEAVATMIGCLPTQLARFPSKRTQRKRLRLDGNRA